MRPPSSRSRSCARLRYLSEVVAPTGENQSRAAILHLLAGGTTLLFQLRTEVNTDSLSSVFDFHREVFDATLQFRVFQLNTGVFVSSPLAEIGKSVQITEGQQRSLSCQGEIANERLRIRHA